MTFEKFFPETPVDAPARSHNTVERLRENLTEHGVPYVYVALAGIHRGARIKVGFTQHPGKEVLDSIENPFEGVPLKFEYLDDIRAQRIAAQEQLT